MGPVISDLKWRIFDAAFAALGKLRKCKEAPSTSMERAERTRGEAERRTTGIASTYVSSWLVVVDLNLGGTKKGIGLCTCLFYDPRITVRSCLWGEAKKGLVDWAYLHSIRRGDCRGWPNESHDLFSLPEYVINFKRGSSQRAHQHHDRISFWLCKPIDLRWTHSENLHHHCLEERINRRSEVWLA